MNVIYFDLDGTLLHLDREYHAVLAEVFRAVEGEAPAKTIEAYDEAFRRLFRECTPDPFRQAFATVSNNPDRLVETLREREVAACRPPEHAHQHLSALAADYTLGVLTNGVRSWQRHKLAAHDLTQYFDTVVTSYDVGAHKPAPEPFERAEAQLPADDYAMVGDSDADMTGAARAGWTTYRYRGQGLDGLPTALEWE